MKSIIYGIALLTILLTGCSVSRDILNPMLPMPEQFRNLLIENDSSLNVDMEWRSFYPDATLRALIDTALVKNYDMQIALNRIQSAEVMLRQSKWNNVPQLSLNTGASYSRPSKNSLSALNLQQFDAGNHIEDYTANLSFAWEADIWGKIKNQNKSALATFLQTEEARRMIQTDIVARVSQSYYNLLMLDTQLDIARKNVALATNTLKIINLQYQSGQVTLLAVQQTEALKAQTAELVPSLEQRIILQENALRILTGQLPDRIIRNNNFLHFNFNPGFSAGIPSVALRARPDVKSAELALRVSNAEVGIAAANLYPSLRITASGGVNAFRASDWFNLPGSLFGLVAGNIAQPLFNQRRLRSNLELAKLQRDQSVISFRQSVLTAAGEVSDALASIEKLSVQADIASTKVTTLQQATTNADMLFKSGMANYLEVISAQENVLKSELELASLRKAQLTAYSDLYRSLGGGWK